VRGLEVVGAKTSGAVAGSTVQRFKVQRAA
jgi:hypothetical protein